MVTTDDYSYKPGLAAAPAAAAPPSFQQHHPLPLQLHGDGGGDHDKVLLRPLPDLPWPAAPVCPVHRTTAQCSAAPHLHLFLAQHAPGRSTSIPSYSPTR